MSTIDGKQSEDMVGRRPKKHRNSLSTIGDKVKTWWGEGNKKKHRNSLSTIGDKQTEDMVARWQESIDSFSTIRDKQRTILADETHPLRPQCDDRHPAGEKRQI